jgi:hypothetical protein
MTIAAMKMTSRTRALALQWNGANREKGLNYLYNNNLDSKGAYRDG